VLALQAKAGNRATAGTIRLARQVHLPPPPLPPGVLPAPPEPDEDRAPVAAALRLVGARTGDSGGAVLRLQCLLNAFKGERTLDTDGVYGDRTRQAVEDFQLAMAGKGIDLSEAPDAALVLGEATPATIRALEEQVRDENGGHGLRDLECYKEALRYVRDHRDSRHLSLQSAIRAADQLAELDSMDNPSNEIDYWAGVAEHANRNFQRAIQLYDSAVDAGEDGWPGLQLNADTQAEAARTGRKPVPELNPDPNLAESDDDQT
jgi:peptidoglycan hydrolase-like protein with peptidoglycan-binding domain